MAQCFSSYFPPLSLRASQSISWNFQVPLFTTIFKTVMERSGKIPFLTWILHFLATTSCTVIPMPNAIQGLSTQYSGLTILNLDKVRIVVTASQWVWQRTHVNLAWCHLNLNLSETSKKCQNSLEVQQRWKVNGNLNLNCEITPWIPCIRPNCFSYWLITNLSQRAHWSLIDCGVCNIQ